LIEAGWRRGKRRDRLREQGAGTEAGLQQARRVRFSENQAVS